MPTCYHVVLATTHQYFSSRVMEFCGQFDLSFFLVEPVWVEDFVRKLQAGEVRARVLFDMASDAYEPGNLYFALAKEVKRSGGHVVDDPDRASVMAHKGMFHKLLEEHGIDVPETIVVERGQLESFRLTEEAKARLGVPFVVKPGWGGGRLGVITDARSEEDLHRSAREAWYSDTFLVQKKVAPRPLDSHVGWFRVFHVFGEVIPCWWEPPANQYQIVTPLQQRIYKLGPLTRLVREIARISRIKFFSTEVCFTSDGRFLPIDYLNTECDMHAKSFFPTGVPDEVARHIAWRFVDYAMTVTGKRRRPFADALKEKDEDWYQRRKKGMLVPGE